IAPSLDCMEKTICGWDFICNYRFRYKPIRLQPKLQSNTFSDDELVDYFDDYYSIYCGGYFIFDKP
ncbi:MAG TPA: hypothetical protein VFC67_24810, partial [Prolixibacteraceae bacterium]|nr:hypothetical protein [Prolixibacteraceae bacterium]